MSRFRGQQSRSSRKKAASCATESKRCCQCAGDGSRLNELLSRRQELLTRIGIRKSVLPADHLFSHLFMPITAGKERFAKL
jgi:hypothetical protein